MSFDENFARLREIYPDAIETIEAEEKRVQELLEQQEFYLLPTTQRLLALCRNDILTARVKLATERTLDEGARAELWHVIDAREWFLQMVSKDFDAELAQIEQQLERDLAQ
jgi:hypothetical protein